MWFTIQEPHNINYILNNTNNIHTNIQILSISCTIFAYYSCIHFSILRTRSLFFYLSFSNVSCCPTIPYICGNALNLRMISAKLLRYWSSISIYSPRTKDMDNIYHWFWWRCRTGTIFSSFIIFIIDSSRKNLYCLREYPHSSRSTSVD